MSRGHSHVVVRYVVECVGPQLLPNLLLFWASLCAWITRSFTCLFEPEHHHYFSPPGSHSSPFAPKELGPLSPYPLPFMIPVGAIIDDHPSGFLKSLLDGFYLCYCSPVAHCSHCSQRDLWKMQISLSPVSNLFWLLNTLRINVKLCEVTDTALWGLSAT